MYADKVLVNKVDLVEESEKEEKVGFVRSCIRKVNSEALIEMTSYAKVELEEFLSELEGVRAAKKKVSVEEQYLEKVHKLQHKIVDEINSHYVIEANAGLLDRKKLEPAIGAYLWDAQGSTEILRCKGKFFAKNEADQPAEYLLQGVGEVFEFREIEQVQSSGPFEHKFLFVGRQIDPAQMQAMVKKSLE